MANFRFKKNSNNTEKAGNKVFGLLFGCVFFAAGAFFCWMMGLSPLLKSINSKGWIEASCIIDSCVSSRATITATNSASTHNKRFRQITAICAKCSELAT